MKTLYGVMILIIFSVTLIACTGINHDESDTPRDQTTRELKVNNDNQEANDDDQDEREPNAPTTPDPADNKQTSNGSETSEEPQEKEQEPIESQGLDEVADNKVVLENEAFQIFEPMPDANVKDELVVKGIARVFEGTIQYELEDGHFIIDKGFTTASKGGPEWGKFEIEFEIGGAPEGSYRIFLYEESAKDGSKMHELMIPIQINK